MSSISPSAISGFPMLAQADKLLQAGKYEEAARCAMAHLRQTPEEPRGMALLGTVALRLGALGQAEHFLKRAIARGSNDFEIRRNLASALNQQEKLDAAAAMVETMHRENPDPMLSGLLGLIWDKIGRTSEALQIRQNLAEQNPENPYYWIYYGHSLRAEGRVDEAVAAYRKAAEADYECGEAWWGLASIKSKILTDEDMVQMQRAIAIAVDVRNSAPAHFALARAHHDRGDYAKAFEHYETANRQRADDIGYDSRELTAEVDEAERSISAESMRRMDRAATSENVPVFVVSLPRSGSTLLEQMLGSHPAIEPVGELPYIPAILRSVMELATRKGKVTVPQLIAAIPDEQADRMADDYLRRAQWHRKTDKRFFVDKLPHNWSNILFIRRILPQARFIDIRRPAMDCCFSNFTQSFSTAHASSFVLEDIARCYVDYVRYMDHLEKIAPAMVHHIAYERLIEDAETELKSILAYLDLPWDAAMLDFHKSDRVVRTPSSEQVRRPLNRDGVDIWRPYSQWLDPLRTTLGVLADGN